jgi:ferredoxin-type protein NapG
MAANNPKLSRRQFLKASASAVISLAVVGSAAYYFKDKSSVLKTGVIRPPGSREEEEFLYACIKCGLCVQICPVHAIKLADWDHYLSYGTPYIDVNQQACDFSCDAIQCAETCPTAAINFKIFKHAGDEAIAELTKKYNGKLPPNVNPFEVQISAMKKADKMGVAKIPDPKQCLAYHGQGYKGKLGKTHSLLRPPGSQERIYIDEVEVNREICDLCVVYCPLGDEAIELKDLGNGKYLPEIKDGCVGCGVCQMLCPTDPKAIIIEPFKGLQTA